MTTIKAVVRDGRIELDERLDLPDGTVLRIPLPNGDLVSDDDDAPMTPEEIERVLSAMDAIIPFERTPEEEARLEADRLARKEWEKTHFFEHADKLAGMWK
jgi:hypothetical protein